MNNNIDIEVVGIKIEQLPSKTPGKTYNQMTVTHKEAATGKLDGKKLVEFYTDKALWNTFTLAQAGDFYSVDREKNDKGYWDWKAVHRQDNPPAAVPQKVFNKARTGYDADLQRERFEFDKEKQPLIIRQSCLSSAVQFAVANKLDQKATLELAQTFVNWVQADGMSFLKEDKFPDVFPEL